MTYCILHKECKGCSEGLKYTARFYPEPVDASLPFNQLPSYNGSCNINILNLNGHLTMMEFREGKFEHWHQLDLWLSLLEAEPTIETASWERHKFGAEVPKVVNIIDRIKYLTRGKG